MSLQLLVNCLGPTLPVGAPETRAIAVATVNGQAALGGNSQQLGSAMDAALLQHLRRWSDVVLVGARTVRAENYGGVKIPASVRKERASRSQVAVPPIAVISRSLQFDPSSRLFTDTLVAPLILTPNRDEDAARPLKAAGATVVCVPDDDYLGALHRHGYQRVLIEGGPMLYSQALRRDAVDLIHLTIDPTLVLGSPSPLLYDAQEPGAVIPLDLEHVESDPEGCVFLRYRVRK